jgi:large subunit ribosomal protein L4
MNSSKKVSRKTEDNKKKIDKAKIAVASVTKKNAGLSLDVLNTEGKVTGRVELPKEIFGINPNPVLIAQAVRVYLANMRMGSAEVKTRGEVAGSTRKIWRQKGTGRARHGDIKAPIFVGGGIAHGPTRRDYSLKLPKQMRRKALFAALSAKLQEGAIHIVSDLNSLEPKTKLAASLLQKIFPENAKGQVLLLTSKDAKHVHQAWRNLPHVQLLPIVAVDVYDVVKSSAVILMREAIPEITAHFLKGGNNHATS